MKFAALVSGGKDSIYSILACLRQNHELICCVHLAAPPNDGNHEESYMYQTAGSEVVRVLCEQCLQVPLILHQRSGRSVNTSLVYDNIRDGVVEDEVEDLYQALTAAQAQFPGLQAVSSGAILSTYQRTRVEHVCQRLGLTSLAYLWRAMSQHDLLQAMIDDGVEAVLVRVAAPPGLVPPTHLGQSITDLQPLFHDLYDRYQFHVAGEGGEYETLVTDCPLYHARLVLDETRIVVDDDDDTSGVLVVTACHTEPKLAGAEIPCHTGTFDVPAPRQSTLAASEESSGAPVAESLTVSGGHFLPRISRSSNGGLFHVGAMISPTMRCGDADNDAGLAVVEARAIFQLLNAVLTRHGCTAQDVVMVHLYLSEISHFARINAYYQAFFGVVMPPSRSCVAVGPHVLPNGRHVCLDCLVQAGSGDYLRGNLASTNPVAQAALVNTTSRWRQVLHVQSRSSWAPTCVGPYSQVNTVHSCWHFVAGQIGLVPATMMLRDTWQEQLQQAWMNAARVLDALDGGGSLEHVISALIYVVPSILDNPTLVETLAALSFEQLECNGGVQPGVIDTGKCTLPADDLDGYEDLETKLAIEGPVDYGKSAVGHCPLLVVAIPEMPMGAQVEVEIVASTRTAATCMGMRQWSNISDRKPYTSQDSRLWSTFPSWCKTDPTAVARLHCHVRQLGDASAGVAMVVVDVLDSNQSVAPRDVITDMFQSLGQATAHFEAESCLHVRFYYKVPAANEPESHLSEVQSVLAEVIATHLANVAAYTAVPVSSIELVTDFRQRCTNAIYAMQVMFFDIEHATAEFWIHNRTA